MNFVSSTILEVMSERFKDNPSYLVDIKNEIESHQNKYDGLMYLFKVDKIGREMFAKKIGVTLEEINSTLEVLRAI